MAELTRRLGRSGIVVSALGLGTNPIGGSYWDPAYRPGQPIGYGPADPAEAVRALQRALDLGVTFFDTADEYGCGQSERLLGQALAGRREQAVISTKFGYTFDEDTRTITGTSASPAYIRQACEASLRRLGTDYIDIYLLHLRDLGCEAAGAARQTLEDLAAEGKILWYGWSTDDVERARFFAEGPHCAVIEHRLNLLIPAVEMLAVCEELDLGSINRIPLLMGILTGKFRSPRDLPEEDVRRAWFSHQDALAGTLHKLEPLQAVLTEGGRSLAQAALAWIWAHSPRAVPVPGFKTVRQVEENAAAMRLGPLSPEQMQRVEALIER